MTELEKLMVQLGDRAATIGENLAALVLSDVSEFLSNMGVDAAKCPALIRQIAMVRINQLGSEGVASESYSGISQSFLADLPADIRREIFNLRAVRF
jgi:hypothetical protein